MDYFDKMAITVCHVGDDVLSEAYGTMKVVSIK
jgi:hypothetical protein